jgi:hypothetical protein
VQLSLLYLPTRKAGDAFCGLLIAKSLDTHWRSLVTKIWRSFPARNPHSITPRAAPYKLGFGVE